MKTQTQLAIEIAEEAHKGQIRTMGADRGQPYIVHPLRVAAAVAKQLGDEAAVAAAHLHDVLEDTDWTADKLRERGVTDQVIRLVGVLTHCPSESYLEYIQQVRIYGPTAVAIKMADIHDNLHSLPNGSMRDKYELAMHILVNG